MHRADLPADPAERDGMILSAMGSPDPYSRQLDGMGGGISSLSKVVIVARSSLPDIDIEYSFGQVSVTEAAIYYVGNCGNLTAAVAAFAVDEGLVLANDGILKLTMLNLNSGKVVSASLQVEAGEAVVTGDLVIDGVSGAGAPIRLQFVDPAGGLSGQLFPTGSPIDVLEVEGLGPTEVTIVDAGAAVVFVEESELGFADAVRLQGGAENAIEMACLDAIRNAAVRHMNAAGEASQMVRQDSSEPSIALVTPGRSGLMEGRQADIFVQSVVMGMPHKAIPVTTAMCVAVAAKIRGTVVNSLLGKDEAACPINIGHPAGLCSVEAVVTHTDAWHVESVTVFRTARRLMRGLVYVPRD